MVLLSSDILILLTQRHPSSLTNRHPEHEADEREDGQLEDQVNVNNNGHGGHPGETRRQEGEGPPVGRGGGGGGEEYRRRWNRRLKFRKGKKWVKRLRGSV